MTSAGATLRARLESQRAALDERLRQGIPASELLPRWGQSMDAALIELFEQHLGADSPCTLCAVGGYGRGELLPASDVDLLVLMPEVADGLRSRVERFITDVWDIGYQIGHAVRTPAECAAGARDDLTIFTNLLEARLLAGSTELFEGLQESLAAPDLWPIADFYQAKVEEQLARHQRFRHIDNNLEPDIKNSPGALRDIHVVQWVACRYYGTLDLRELHDRGFLAAEELSVLRSGQEFLWRVRWTLQMVDPRARNRLHFDSQRAIAELLGYQESPGTMAVEEFMHEYFRQVLQLRAVNDILLQHIRETLLPRPAGTVEVVRPLNARFRTRDGYLEFDSESVLVDNPSALLELFVLLGRHAEIQGVRSATIRQIRAHLHLINAKSRQDPRNAQLFMEFLRSPQRLAENFDRMRRYGVLGAWLPEFQQITGQMQHDLFHIYTVDVHTLQVVGNLWRFRHDSARQDYPLAWRCLQDIERPEILYVAALYHDIAKGRGGDHSELGAVDARAFCARHGITDESCELIVWLIESHLLMSQIAQRRDISDPEVVWEFATRVGTMDRLDHLYALTVADITATNPELWNSWRASLMSQLYNATGALLRSSPRADVSRTEEVESTVSLALAQLAENGIDQAEAERLWHGQTDDYFLRQNANDIAWQTQAIQGHDPASGPLVRLRNASSSGTVGERVTVGSTAIFLHTRNQPNLFAVTIVVLDQLLLSVQGARAFSSVEDVCFNTYFVLNDADQPIPTAAHARLEREIVKRMTRHLADPRAVPPPAKRLIPRAVAQFPTAPAVHIDNEESNDHTTLRVIANDHPGVLAAVCRVFIELDITVHNARIATLGETIEDSFRITLNGGPVTDHADQLRLQADLTRLLEASSP